MVQLKWKEVTMMGTENESPCVSCGSQMRKQVEQSVQGVAGLGLSWAVLLQSFDETRVLVASWASREVAS